MTLAVPAAGQQHDTPAEHGPATIYMGHPNAARTCVTTPRRFANFRAEGPLWGAGAPGPSPRGNHASPPTAHPGATAAHRPADPQPRRELHRRAGRWTSQRTYDGMLGPRRQCALLQYSRAHTPVTGRRSSYTRHAAARIVLAHLLLSWCLGTRQSEYPPHSRTTPAGDTPRTHPASRCAAPAIPGDTESLRRSPHRRRAPGEELHMRPPLPARIRPVAAPLQRRRPASRYTGGAR